MIFWWPLATAQTLASRAGRAIRADQLAACLPRRVWQRLPASADTPEPAHRELRRGFAGMDLLSADEVFSLAEEHIARYPH